MVPLDWRLIRSKGRNVVVSQSECAQGSKNIPRIASGMAMNQQAVIAISNAQAWMNVAALAPMPYYRTTAQPAASRPDPTKSLRDACGISKIS